MLVMYTDDLGLQTHITKDTINEAMKKLPKFVLDLLEFHVKVYITDIFKATGINAVGCYYIEDTGFGTEQAVILIDKKNCLHAKSVFYHEVGHFLDDILGCKKEHVPYTKKNCSVYRFSQNDETFQNCNMHENDFFTEMKREKKDAIYYEDMREAFADCFAEIIMRKRYLNMRMTKNVIISELKENFSKKHRKAS